MIIAITDTHTFHLYSEIIFFFRLQGGQLMIKKKLKFNLI